MEGRMITILDLKAEFAKLTLLRGRTPQTTEVERKGSGAFATLAPFRDGNIFSAKFAGDGAWERHPNGDELVQIVDGWRSHAPSPANLALKILPSQIGRAHV